jgi:cell division inhibitor SepF
MVVEPFSFDDAQHVADHLRNRKPVVINLESTDKEVAKRMIDFISGTTYALNGSIQKIGNNIFLCAPNNVDVAYSTREEGIEKSFLPWSSKH